MGGALRFAATTVARRATAFVLALLLSCVALLPACGRQVRGTEGRQGRGLLLALAVFEKGPGGPRPGPARFATLVEKRGRWVYAAHDDPDSNVFHKAMAFDLSPVGPGILTAGGTRAMLKVWRKGGPPVVAWKADFGGRFSRMRDAEIADIYGDGHPVIIVGTHDQGVVAVVRPAPAGSFSVEELDREPDTWVHEVEVGDVDGDGILEVYASRSRPNLMNGAPQSGSVVRYVPAKKEGRRQVVDLGNRHAKEILVADLDGNGRDELYVSVEAVSGGQVEILRFDGGNLWSGGTSIAIFPDTMCRCLTAGDIDGDGRKELVAATHKSGLWLLRPGDDPRAAWAASAIDRDSSGIEHAALLTDLDGDGVDELYVADDDHHEVNRYRWKQGSPVKETIYRYPQRADYLTWNIMPVPVELIF
jgi:hypothetical protein